MLEGQLILVTGATGFVGRALVEHLLASGVEPGRLRLLVRDARRAAAVGLPAASLVQGHLAAADAVSAAARGVATAFHIAGAVKAGSRQEFMATNAGGTEIVVRALCAGAPGCRLVHVSSLAAAGPSVHGETSALPPERCRPWSDYGESKRRGELAVQAVGERLAWVIVRPPVVYGPRDAATRLLFRQALAPLVAVPWRARPLSLIHVRDLVSALALTARASIAQRVLPVEGPDRHDTDSLACAIAAACGRGARLVRVPLACAWPIALGCDWLGRLRGRPPWFGRDKLRDLRAPGWVADPAPAREALGFVPSIPTAVGFRETAMVEGRLRAAPPSR